MNKISSRITKATQSGFTLIELVIVIVIIGILAAVALPNFTNTTDSANKAVNNAIVGAVKSAWAVAYAANKGTPTLAQLATATSDPACVVSGTNLACPAASSQLGTTKGTLVITIPQLTSTLGYTCNVAAEC